MFAHDLTNKRYGQLTVIKRVRNPILDRRDAWWLCVCDCGEKIKVPAYNLKRNNTTSCGCARRGPKLTEGGDDLL
jgi:hypothetical protein